MVSFHPKHILTTMSNEGAGISVDAGIPDFRSSDGLFRSLRKGYLTLASGKDLFDVSVFKVSGVPMCFVVRKTVGWSDGSFSDTDNTAIEDV